MKRMHIRNLILEFSRASHLRAAKRRTIQNLTQEVRHACEKLRACLEDEGEVSPGTKGSGSRFWSMSKSNTDFELTVYKLLLICSILHDVVRLLCSVQLDARLLSKALVSPSSARSLAVFV